MARILPDSPIGPITPEAAKIFRLLNKLPDDQFVVWHRLSIWDEPGPDFWVRDKKNRSLLIKISQATSNQANALIQPGLFTEEVEPIGIAEEQTIRNFLDQAIGNYDEDGRNGGRIPCLIVFPNVTSNEVNAALMVGPKLKISWIGKESLIPDSFQSAIEEHLGAPSKRSVVSDLRKAFTPEVIVPSEFTVRGPIERNVEPSLTDYLLDYNQEWALKLDLDLEEQAQRAAKDFSVRLINGVAGSGKSLIIVYRAFLLSKLFPTKPILVLTHNKALIGDLEYRFKCLTNSTNNVEWSTFHGWCDKYLSKYEGRIMRIGEKRRDKLLSEIWRGYLLDTPITAGMLRDEIDWYKDRLLFSRKDYLNADRTGRGFGLNQPMRKRIYEAQLEYDNQLKLMKLQDWGDIPRKIWSLIQTNEITFPKYDAILIDEAQFFAPIWFEIIKHIIDPSNGHLFLVADPAQGFLKRRQSWIASGLEVRGRSHRLHKSYRTTRRILDFATYLYRTRIPEDDEEVIAPNLLDMPEGGVPEIIPLTTPQDEITRVANEVVELVRNRIPLEYILLIHTNWSGVDQLISQLGKKLGPSSVADAKEAPRGQHIRVCTLIASAGLESPIVFIVGLRDLCEEEQSLCISDEERVELVRDNTRKLYMAITRAGQRLVMTYVGNLPDWLKSPLLRVKYRL